jgi:hypothetical protein
MPDGNTAFEPHIPAAVRRASAQADELSRQATEAALAEAGQDDTTVVPGEVAPSPSPTPPPAAPSSATEAGDSPPSAPPAAPAPADDWAQRYNTLQGKYNTEIPELRGQIRALENLLAAVQAAPSKPDPTPTPMPAANVPQNDIEEYGQPLIEAAQRWAEAKFAPILQAYEARLLAVEGNTQRVTSMTAEQGVQAALSRSVPDWQEINVNPAFIQWLGEVDPFSGQTRKQMVNDAYGAGDSARTIAFFQAFKREHTTVSPAPGTQPGQTGGSSPPADRLPLESLAVPGRGQQTTPPTPGAPEKRFWSTVDITRFYREKQQGRWRGREAEADRLEADIIAAPAEGRVR